MSSLVPPWLRVPLAVGAALRILWVLAVPIRLASDAFVYDTGARQLAAGNGFSFADGNPNGYWPIGYSAFLSPLYAVFGDSPVVGVVANLFLSTALIAVVGHLSHRLFQEAVGRLAAWLVALYPGLILYTTVVASENLFLLLLGGVALAAVLGKDAPWGVPGQGILLGLAIAVRPTALTFPALTAAGALLRGRGVRGALLRAVLVLGVALVVASPVAIRNTTVFGKTSYTSFNGGPVLWMGNHDGPPTTVLPDYVKQLDVVTRDQVLRDEAKAFILAHPGTFLTRCFTRTVTAMGTETIPVVWNPGIEERYGSVGVVGLKLLATAGWWAVLLLAVVGIVARWGVRRGEVGFLLVGVAINAVPFVVLDSQNRYHLPLLPLLFPLAGAGLLALLDRWRRRRGADDASAAQPGSGATTPVSG